MVGFGDEISELAQHSRRRADNQPIGAAGKSGVFGAFAEIYSIDKLRELDVSPVALLSPAKQHDGKVMQPVHRATCRICE